MANYNPKEIEKKWQAYWEEHPELYAAQDDSGKEKKYILDMFPYPSGEGLHVGHVESYTATDIVSRFYRLNGKNVLHPQGWDAFGLPAENYAIKTGTHPSITTQKNIQNFTRQIKSLGMSYDWSREINTSSPDYYKWTQWFFLLLYKNGLAYKKMGKVNWCPSCQTVLANEQVEDGICERCKNEVVQKDLEQWYFKITDFIENNKNTTGLIEGLDKIDWPDSTKAAQKNWIGKSEGAEFEFKVISDCSSPSGRGCHEVTGEGEGCGVVTVYTTRLDTVFGVTYVVIAPEHELVKKLKDKIENYSEVEKYLEDSKKKSDLERMEAKEKSGVELKGIKVVNPFNNEQVPLFVADYVLSQYGTGAVMAVPAHDERDFEFAKKYNLPIREVVVPFTKYNTMEGKPTEERDLAVAIVYNPKDDTYLCLDWKSTVWHSFPAGGTEGENFEIAAKRELLEETGYKNIRLIKEFPNTLMEEFYRPHKDSNVIARYKYLLFELENEEREEVSEKEKSQHEAVWIKKEDVANFLNIEHLKIFWKDYISGNVKEFFLESGKLVDSSSFNGLYSDEAREKMIQWLEEKGIGRRKINYRLRDWLVSRQRYWGAPIPIIYCEDCGEVPVPEDQLPVKLPTDVDFKPTGESPLVYSKTFHDVNCPKCGKKAKRESDTMDTFVCSSWYYFRYADPKNEKEFASTENVKKWLPVDIYVGGAEHSVLHLLYARFFTKVLHNLGMIDFDEPFLKMRHQGIILAEDGRKMSKSLGNVVNPDDIVAEFGADSLRMFEMFMGPLEEIKPWNTKGIVGMQRFLEKVYKLQSTVHSQQFTENGKVTSLLHKTIKKVTNDIESFRFNTAISAMMILINTMEKEKAVSIIHYSQFLILLSPFAPHLTEELWEKLGNKESIFLQSWPQYNAELAKDEEVEMVVQVNGRVRDRLMVAADVTEDEVKETALESEKVKVFTEGKEIKKIIFVPNKLINIVVE